MDVKQQHASVEDPILPILRRFQLLKRDRLTRLTLHLPCRPALNVRSNVVHHPTRRVRS